MLELIEHLRSIATEGLTYAKDPYDRERYSKLLNLTSEQLASASGLSKPEILKAWSQESGCVTPKLGVIALLATLGRKYLILRRTDDRTWCFPCGWVDIAEDPRDTVIREVKEETALSVSVKKLAGYIMKRPSSANSIYFQVNLVFLTNPVRANAEVSLSHEHDAFKWISGGSVVTWHPGHDRVFNALVRARRSEIAE